jgi:hypothetical protein
MICQYCGAKLFKVLCTNPACPGRLGEEEVSELKPCPFCGGEATRDIIFEGGSNYGGEIIGCKKCLASTRVFFGGKEESAQRGAWYPYEDCGARAKREAA